MSAKEQVTDAYNQNATVGTIYIPFGGDASLVQSAQLQWDAVLVAGVTVESCNFPEPANNSVIAGEWAPEAVPAVTNVVGGSAGGAMLHVSNNGARRLRLKVVVSTAGGLRVRAHGKD